MEIKKVEDEKTTVLMVKTIVMSDKTGFNLRRKTTCFDCWRRYNV
jgi:hypothetical protein